MEREEFFEELRAAGVDVDDAIARFAGNTDLFVKFICRFPENLDFNAMRSAMAADDEETFHRQMHTLKGVSGNLGVMKVYNAVEELLVELRANKLKNVEMLKEYLQRIEKICEKVCKVLETYQT